MATIIERLEAASVTDSLLREENPLSNASAWHKPSWDVQIGRTTTAAGWQPVSTFAEGSDGARFDDISFLKKVKTGTYVYSIITCKSYTSIQTKDRYWGAWGLMDLSKQNGYRAIAEFDGSLYKVRLEKFVSGTPTKIGEETGVIMSSGTGQEIGTLAVVAGGGFVYVFLKVGKSSEKYTQILKVADTTYTEGYGGIEARGNFARLANYKVGTFTLAEAPDAVTGAASSVKDVKATLNGEVNPHAVQTDYYFEYGPTTSYGTKVPVTEDGEAGEENELVPVSQNITGLSPNTTYHFRLVAINEKGEDKGEDATFKTEESGEPEGAAVNVRVGGSVVAAQRWIKTLGGLVNV